MKHLAFWENLHVNDQYYVKQLQNILEKRHGVMVGKSSGSKCWNENNRVGGSKKAEVLGKQAQKIDDDKEKLREQVHRIKVENRIKKSNTIPMMARLKF